MDKALKPLARKGPSQVQQINSWKNWLGRTKVPKSFPREPGTHGRRQIYAQWPNGPSAAQLKVAKLVSMSCACGNAKTISNKGCHFGGRSTKNKHWKNNGNTKFQNYIAKRCYIWNEFAVIPKQFSFATPWRFAHAAVPLSHARTNLLSVFWFQGGSLSRRIYFPYNMVSS